VIVRSPRPKAGYTVLDNLVLRHPHLSYKARGLLAYLLSLPDNWKVSADHMARQSPRDGRHAVLSGLAELEDAGYLVRHRHQDEQGRWHTSTLIYDYPQTVDKLSPPKSGFPTSENRTPKEVTTRNDLDGFISSRTHEGTTLVCGHCDGTGWQPGETTELIPCDCGGGLLR
jgi:hypothetical protein